MKITPTYAADFMLISLPKELADIVGSQTELDLEDARLTSYLLHEWLHYIHNTSTINGLSCFTAMIIFWSDFRWKLDPAGLSTQLESLSPKHADAVRRNYSLFQNGRRARPNPPELAQVRTDFTISAAKERREPLLKSIDGQAEYGTVIECDVTVGSDSTVYKAEIGTLEIIEGLAYLCEERYLAMFSESANTPRIAPYQLIYKLSRYLVPDITRDNIIECAITALQSSDSPSLFFKLLSVVNKTPVARRRELLAVNQVKILRENVTQIQTMLKTIEGYFPKHEEMANAVKHLLTLIHQNLLERVKFPFFELDALDHLKSEKQETRAAALSQIIAQLSCCRILVERPGDDDEPRRDAIVFYGKAKDMSDERSFGINKMHAALHYMKLHLNEDGFMDTQKVKEHISSERRRCPFYTACHFDWRVQHATMCKEAPWESILSPMSGQPSCWYREGVRATRRPDGEGAVVRPS